MPPPGLFYRALRARGAGFLQTCHPRGLPGPGPRVACCAARKSPKSRLREGGFRFPPSLKNLIPLKRPRPGASAPALDPAPPGRRTQARCSPPQSRLRRASSPAGGAKGTVRTRGAAAEREGRDILVCARLLPYLPPCRSASNRSAARAWFAPKPLLLLHRARRSSSSPHGEEEEGGA